MTSTAVNGFLYINDLVDFVVPYNEFSANELVAIPYAYTIQ